MRSVKQFGKSVHIFLRVLAVAFAFRTGLFQYRGRRAANGRMVCSGYMSVWHLNCRCIIHLPFALLAAALAGALWGLIPGILKATLRVHEVIVTIMMNYIALHVVNALIKTVSGGSYKTDKIQPTASLRSEFLSNLTDFSTLHYGILVAISHGSCYVVYP